MPQINTGIRAFLAHPVVYSTFQNLMGARRGWRNFVTNYVKPQVNMRILDIGCGPADLLDYLPPVEYWGFDPSESYIAHARTRFGQRGNFRSGMLTEAALKGLPTFDIAVLSGVLHHLDDTEAVALLGLAFRALSPNGRLVTIDPCLAPDQNPIARLLINADRGRNVRDEAGYRALLGQVFVEHRVVVRHKLWPPYTHCFAECQRRSI